MIDDSLAFVIKLGFFGLPLVVAVIFAIRKSLGTKPSDSSNSTITLNWIWIVVIVLVIQVANVVSSRNGARPVAPPPEPTLPGWVMVLLVIGSIGGLFAILYAVLFFRNYDRDVNKAIKLHNAGDKEGAIAWLKAASEGRRPSANRSNTLGIFSIVREDWAGAYQAFLEAEAIGGRQAPFLANQGLALWKLGRLDEAEPLLRQASAMAPTDPTIACNLGHVLADLGRIDDASRQLSIAEMAYEKYIVFPRSAKVPIGQEIAKLREKLGIENDPATGSVAGP